MDYEETRRQYTLLYKRLAPLGLIQIEYTNGRWELNMGELGVTTISSSPSMLEEIIRWIEEMWMSEHPLRELLN